MDVVSQSDELMPTPLAPIMRSDGSLRYDMMSSQRIREVLPPLVQADPGVQTIMELCDRGLFHPLSELFGNIGLERFSDSRRTFGEVISSSRMETSRFGSALTRALLKAVKAMQDREPKARAAEHLIAQTDVVDQLAREVLALESRCAMAGETRRHQASCRQDFWRLWELSWAVRIFSPEERVIESLEKMYARFSCLELREGDRRKLQLPGGLCDPRLQEDRAVELW